MARPCATKLLLSVAMTTKTPRARVTVPKIRDAKSAGHTSVPIVMVTAYDATFARLADESGVDIILVGDSLGMVMQGHADTLPVTLDEMLYHTRCVARVSSYAQIVLDLPFMSYQLSPEQALQSAGRAIKEGGAHAVKLEGGAAVRDSVARIVAAGIPVMGHLGLTPQSVHAFGGFRVQARDEQTAAQLIADALDLQRAGCYCLVLEGIPAPLAKRVSTQLAIPTIGIGAGIGCDGQVLVMHDLLGLEDRFKPRFVQRYADLANDVRAAFSAYAADVRLRRFPTEEHSFGLQASPDAKSASSPSDRPNAAVASEHVARPTTGGYGPADEEPAVQSSGARGSKKLTTKAQRPVAVPAASNRGISGPGKSGTGTASAGTSSAGKSSAKKVKRPASVAPTASRPSRVKRG